MTAPRRLEPPPIHWSPRPGAKFSAPTLPTGAQAKAGRAGAIPPRPPLNLRRFAPPAVATRAAQQKPAPRAAAPVQFKRMGPPPRSPVATGIIQRMEEAPDDVLPFIDERHRTDIPFVDITGTHRGTYAYQVTKLRNLPGIRLYGLLPSHGGTRIGLSQNPSQRESLLVRSLTNSRGRVTVGTSSVVIDNYRKKGQDWHDRLEADLKVVVRSKNDGDVFAARHRLCDMAWLHDPLLDELLSCEIEDDDVRTRFPKLTRRVRKAFATLFSINWINAPCILRLPSRSATWRVDPDDPQGFQTETGIDRASIELLHNGAWIEIKSGTISDFIGSIVDALSQEREALEMGRELLVRRRERMGIEGADVPRELPSEIAEMMGL